MGALKAMFSFFTMLRIDIDEDDMMAMDRSFHLVPLVGLFYGVMAFVMLTLLSAVVDTLIAAVATLFAVSMMNRFLHLDGVMDLGDGLVVSGGREDHLRALKDSRIGAGGVAFAVFATLLAVTAWSALVAAGIIVIVLMAEVYSRNASVAAAAFGIPGPGMAGESVRNTGLLSLIKSSTLSVAVTLPFLLYLTHIGDWSYAQVLVITVLMLAVSVTSGWSMSKVAYRNFGMVNGDVLGATNELTRSLLAIASLAVFSWMFW